MRALSTVSRSIFGWVSAAVAVAVIAVSASVLAAPGKAYADTASHIEATGEIHALVDGAGNASIPNVILKNTGSVAAYVTGCSAPAELTGWTCDAVGKRIEPGQSVQASWSGQVSAETAAKLGCEAYFAGTLTYSYDDAELKATVAIDNQNPCVGDTVTASVSGLNVSDDQVTYQWYRVKNGIETAIDGAVQPAYTVVDADADCTLLCKLFSSDSICIGSVSSDATHEVKRAVEAFAVYSADDNSLNFYKRAGMPSAGEQFEGKTATAVYTGIEKDTYSTTTQPWRNYASTITTAAVIDQNIAPTSTANWFYKLSNMTSCDLGKLDTSNVISMANMFNNCKSLNTLSDISNWNTSNVTSTGYMFYNCSSLSDISDLTNWNTSSITYFYSMFYGCSNLTTLNGLSNWNTSNVTKMCNMFENCSKLTSIGDLSNWNTSKVTDMISMFEGCSNLTTLNGLSNWDTSKVTLMASMFFGCTSLTALDFSNWDTSKVTNMSAMFQGCSNLTTLNGLSNWDTSKVTNMYWLFYYCSSLSDLNLSNWNTSKVTNMNSMFGCCSSLTSLDLSGWSTSNVINMRNMFSGCDKLQEATFGENWKWVGDYGYLPTPSRTYITGADGKWYDTDGNGYVPEDIPSNKAMTYTAIGPKTAFAVYSAGDGSLNFYKRAGMPSAGEQFEGKTATAVYTGIETMTSRPWSGYASNIKTATVVDDGIRPCNMNSWFYGCKSMTACDLGKLDTSNVAIMQGTFADCKSLISLDISNWNTSKVTDMSGMFYGCTKLASLDDPSNWNTSKATSMDSMFGGCSSLTSLDLSGWSTSNVINMRNMFSGCTKLQKVTFGANWKWVGTDGYLPTPSSTYITGADGKWYDTDGNGYAPKDIPSNKAMTYTAIDPKPAFAVYSADDGSLNFYKRAGMPSAGEQFEGKTATAVYTGIKTMTSRPWSGYASNIKTATVVDDGIAPFSTAQWFQRYTSLTSADFSKLDTSNVTNMQSMFEGCSNLTTLDLSSWDTSNVTNMYWMFEGCSNLTTLNLSSWDTSNVTGMYMMFDDCSNLTTLNLSNWDTSKVTNMGSMFSGCSNLTSVGDLSSWDTSKATSMHMMFYRCSNLTSVGDLSSWDTSKVTNMSRMFYGCSKLSADCSNWDVSKVTGHMEFNMKAPGVTVPLAWQASNDEGVEDSTIAPLCEEQGHGKALSVSGENDNDKTASKTDGEASADSETEGSNTASATDEAGAKEEEASGDIANDNVATV